MRKKLQAGSGRILAAMIIGGAAFYLLYRYWEPLIATGKVNPLDAGQKVAFVAAAFSVTAYNLRTRVIDLILKIEDRPSRVAGLCAIARECGTKLTNLVLLFTATAFLMGAGGFIPTTHLVAKWYSCFSVGLFGASVVQFAYVLFAFERLERFVLDEAEKKSDQQEAERLVGS